MLLEASGFRLTLWKLIKMSSRNILHSSSWLLIVTCFFFSSFQCSPVHPSSRVSNAFLYGISTSSDRVTAAIDLDSWITRWCTVRVPSRVYARRHAYNQITFSAGCRELPKGRIFHSLRYPVTLSEGRRVRTSTRWLHSSVATKNFSFYRIFVSKAFPNIIVSQ